MNRIVRITQQSTLASLLVVLSACSSMQRGDGAPTAAAPMASQPSAVVVVPPKPVNDLNGDGKSDLLWQNGTDLYAWFMTGSTYTFAYFAGPPSPWVVAGIGDFDGDGTADVLWRNGPDMYIWFMHGNLPFTFAYVSAPPDPWQVVAVGDVNGDGKADIVWRNGGDGYVWFMTGSTFTSAYLNVPPPPWRVAAVGDFDGDGKTDLLWRNGTDVYVWYMNGGTYTFGYFGAPPAPWEVVGAGDFDGDGKADVLWKNGADMYIWYMHGALPATADYLAAPPSPWQVAQVGDFDGDGKADILWKNGADIQPWFMSGATFTSGALSGPASPWGVVGSPHCVASVACAPATANPCRVFATACDASGIESCAPVAAVADGTVCGNGLVCSAGTCATPASPAPTITGVSPASGQTGALTQVTITGTNFVNGGIVRFGGAAGTIVGQVLATQITVTTPPSLVAGPVDVTFENPFTGQSTTAASAYTFLAPAPTIDAVSNRGSPPAGGITMNITGVNYQPGITATFGGAPATGLVLSDAAPPRKLLTLTVPPQPVGAGAFVDIVIRNPDGQTATFPGFHYGPPPVVTSVSVAAPATLANVHKGDIITITGTDFSVGTGVQVSIGQPAVINSATATELVVVAPKNNPGIYTAVVTNTDGQTGVGAGFNVVYPGP